jgi:hypothetical protein
VKRYFTILSREHKALLAAQPSAVDCRQAMLRCPTRRVACVGELSRTLAPRQSESSMLGCGRECEIGPITSHNKPHARETSTAIHVIRSNVIAPVRRRQAPRYRTSIRSSSMPRPRSHTDTGCNAIAGRNSVKINQQLVIRITTDASARRADSGDV